MGPLLLTTDVGYGTNAAPELPTISNGSAGQVLVSNGASAAPSFQSPTGIIALNPVVASGSSDALPLSGAVFVTTAGVDAMTLATPTAGGPGTGNDGQILLVYDTGGHAHTITTAADKIAPSHDTLTFNGTAGSYAQLIAYNGFWHVLTLTGVTASEA